MAEQQLSPEMFLELHTMTVEEARETLILLADPNDGRGYFSLVVKSPTGASNGDISWVPVDELPVVTEESPPEIRLMRKALEQYDRDREILAAVVEYPEALTVFGVPLAGGEIRRFGRVVA